MMSFAAIAPPRGVIAERDRLLHLRLPAGAPLPAATRQTDKQLRLRVRIRAEASRIIARQGLDGAALIDVARAAGISNSSISTYYPRRRELIHDIIHTHIDALLEHVGTVDDNYADADPFLRLEAVILALLDAVCGAPDEHQVMLAALPTLPDAERDTLRYYGRLLAFRLGGAVEAALPDIAAQRELLAPLTMSLLGMATYANLWFRSDGALTRTAFAHFIARAIVDGGKATLQERTNAPR
jgi:AcrR family transcriptional regulator